MKIGILTYHCVPNFGANLQALSTINHIKKLGHTAIIINWYPRDLEKMYQGRISDQQIKMHEKFVEKFLPLSKRCYLESDIEEVIKEEKIEAVISGSDAILHHVPSSKRKIFSKKLLKYVDVNVTSDRNFPNPFWGTFIDSANPIPAVIFSASSQNMPYFSVNKKEKLEIKNALLKYRHITVRDEWTKELVDFFTDGNIKTPAVTPDPVFAFNYNFDTNTITKTDLIKKYNLPENYVLISFRTNHIKPKWVKTLAKLFEEKGLNCVAFPMPEGIKDYGMRNVINNPLEVLDWYYLIKYSSGYIGERMHPIIVCIHNSVPFFSFDEYGTYKKYFIYNKFIPSSSKIFHILKEGNLLKYIHSYSNRNSIKASEVVNKIINFDQQTCSSFAKKQLESYKNSMEKILSYLT